MTAPTAAFGVGARYGAFFALDNSGFIAAAGTLASVGSQCVGLKTVPVSDPTPRRISHFGNDRVLEQDSLPATEAMTLTMTSSQSNLSLDAYLEGNSVYGVSDGTNNIAQFRAVNSENKGDEPLMFFYTYRQSIKDGVRSYHVQIIPSARVSVITQPFESEATDKTYEFTPTIKQDFLGADLNLTDWGAEEAQAFEGFTDYHPRINAWTANGSSGSQTLSHEPIDANHVSLWIVDATNAVGSLAGAGSIASVSGSVMTTVGTIPNGSLAIVLLQTNAPGNT